MNCLKFTIPNLQIYLPKKANFEKLGLGIDNPCRIVFLSLRMNKGLERVNDRHFWNPGVSSYAMIPRCRPNSRVFFFLNRPIYSLWSQPRPQVRIFHFPLGLFAGSKSPTFNSFKAAAIARPSDATFNQCALKK
jgi:hypothetical protein